MQRYWLIAILLLPKLAEAHYGHYHGPDFCAHNTRFSYLHDAKNELTKEQVFQNLKGQKLIASPLNLHYGYTKGTVWLYFKTKYHKDWQKCVLELANPQLDKIRIFEQVKGRLELDIEMGDLLPFKDRRLQLRNYVYPFRADGDREFLVSMQSSATMTVPVMAQWRDAYINTSSQDYLVLGLFYGLMIFFIFFGLHSYISFRSNAYLLYSGFATALLLFFVDRDGIAYQFLWPNSTEWKLRSVRVFASISMAFGVLYFTYILRLASRRILCFSYGYAGVCILLATALFVFDPAVTNIPTIIVAAATPVAMVVLPLIGIRKGRLFAPYMLVAGLCSLLGFVVYSLSVTDFIPSNYFTDNAMKVSTLFEFFFLTLGLHKMIKRSHKKQADHKAVFEVSNMVAHDLRRPFEMMRMFLKRVHKLQPEQVLPYIDSNAPEIERRIDDADEMMADLSEIGRPDNQGGTVRLAALIPHICNGRYATEINYGGTVQLLDSQLRRSIENIVKNAIQATAGVRDCEFWITAHDEGNFVRLEIGNTGSSISPENLLQVFDFRFTHGKKSGNGIGLSVVQRAAAVGGGRAWAESNGYTSTGRRVPPARPVDYVIFNLKLHKGGLHVR